jgi:hypothetical protein
VGSGGVSGSVPLDEFMESAAGREAAFSVTDNDTQSTHEFDFKNSRVIDNITYDRPLQCKVLGIISILNIYSLYPRLTACRNIFYCGSIILEAKSSRSDTPSILLAFIHDYILRSGGVAAALRAQDEFKTPLLWTGTISGKSEFSACVGSKSSSLLTNHIPAGASTAWISASGSWNILR